MNVGQNLNAYGNPIPRPAPGDSDPVAALRRLLDELAALIEQIEVRIERGAQGALPRLIAENEATTQRIMEGIGTILHDVGLAGQAPEEADLVRELAFARLSDWSSTSPVFYHVRNTPRSEFNNFEIALLLLEHRRGGGTTAAQVLDNYYLNMLTCSSFRNRFTQVAEHLAAETARRASETRPVRILNLHANTCRELELLANNRNFVEAVQITCIDRDPMALRRARQRLERFAGRSQFIRADARKYAASRTWPESPYDIIYTVNLFDQLDDEQTAQLIADCHRGLTPGGALLFGNYSPSLPSAERAIIGWLMNWHIRSRPTDEWRQIFAQTWRNAECVCFRPEALQVSQLVIATHP